VSKAFTNEDAPAPDDGGALPARAGTWPITPAGLARLREELARLAGGKGGGGEPGARRARVIAQALASIYVLEPSAPEGRAAFGARVTVEDAGGQVTAYEIVGPDEVDAAAGRISIASPVGRALLGTRAGDALVLRRPKGDVEVTVRSVTLPAPWRAPRAGTG
jgi:transcription elongation factor GreB